MQARVNPHEIIVVGENSYIRLSVDGGRTSSARCSHWRVFWTPAGAGHALFIDEGAPSPVRIYADNEPLVRYLQEHIERLLHKPFADAGLPVRVGKFERAGHPPNDYREVVRTADGQITLTWSDFLAPFNYSTEPGCDGRPLGLQTTFFPARAATWSVGDVSPTGVPWLAPRDGQPSTSACLAWAETWFRPRSSGG